MKFLKSLCGLLSNIILVALIIVALLFGLTAFLGQKVVPIRDDSMDPEFTKGSVVTAEPMDGDKFSSGQLIAFTDSEGVAVAHRVVRNDKNTKTITAKADTSLINDAPVAYDDVLGHVTMKLPVLGYVVMFVETLAGKISVGVAVVLFVVLKIVSSKLEKKIRKTASSQ